MTRRQSLKLLGELLLDRSNFTTMMRCDDVASGGGGGARARARFSRAVLARRGA